MASWQKHGPVAHSEACLVCNLARIHEVPGSKPGGSIFVLARRPPACFFAVCGCGGWVTVAGRGGGGRARRSCRPGRVVDYCVGCRWLAAAIISAPRRVPIMISLIWDDLTHTHTHNRARNTVRRTKGGSVGSRIEGGRGERRGQLVARAIFRRRR